MFLTSCSVSRCLSAFLAIVTLAEAVTPGTNVARCGVPAPSEAQIAKAREMQVRERSQSLLEFRDDTNHITVPTWFHVVYVNQTERGGFIPVRIPNTFPRRFRQTNKKRKEDQLLTVGFDLDIDQESQIVAQMQEFNDAWAPFDISFDLLNTTYTQNATWSNANIDGWFDMKRSLRQGSYGTLNVYTTLLTDGFGQMGVSFL